MTIIFSKLGQHFFTANIAYLHKSNPYQVSFNRSHIENMLAVFGRLLPSSRKVS